jgi:hypothetical protein
MAVFFSQLDNRWANDKMDNCGITLGSHGCAVTATAMLLTSYGANVTPKTLNDYLGSNNGYDPGCYIRWDVAANFDTSLGIKYCHKRTLTSPEAIRDGLDQGKRVIAVSTRYASHFVWIVRYEPGDQLEWSNFIYWDPADVQQTDRRIGDSWVREGYGTRVFHLKTEQC